MRLAAEIARGTWESFRETLPSNETEAGAWLAGFCWAFAIFWVILLAVTMAWAAAHGIRL